MSCELCGRFVSIVFLLNGKSKVGGGQILMFQKLGGTRPMVPIGCCGHDQTHLLITNNLLVLSQVSLRCVCFFSKNLKIRLIKEARINGINKVLKSFLFCGSHCHLVQIETLLIPKPSLNPKSRFRSMDPKPRKNIFLSI